MECGRRNKLHKKMAFRRKLQILRTLTKSNSVKTSAIIMDAYFYISALKLKLETLKRENINLIKHIDDQQQPLLGVNVEKLARNGYELRITSKKGREILVNILQAFEVMGINVIHAKVSCNGHFAMEATVELIQNDATIDDHQDIDPSVLTQLVLKAIKESGSS